LIVTGSSVVVRVVNSVTGEGVIVISAVEILDSVIVVYSAVIKVEYCVDVIGIVKLTQSVMVMY
jgi:hypothetical protein